MERRINNMRWSSGRIRRQSGSKRKQIYVNNNNSKWRRKVRLGVVPVGQEVMMDHANSDHATTVCAKTDHAIIDHARNVRAKEKHVMEGRGGYLIERMKIDGIDDGTRMMIGEERESTKIDIVSVNIRAGTMLETDLLEEIPDIPMKTMRTIGGLLCSLDADAGTIMIN